MARQPGRKADVPDVRRILKDIVETARKHSRVEVAKFAEEMKVELVERIVTQKFEAFREYPLTEDWLKTKRNLGLDRRVLMATHHYVNSICVIKHSPTSFEVNVPKDARAWDVHRQPIKLSLRALGAIHEYGSAASNIPPRPHWRVIIREATRRAPRVADRIVGKVRQELRKKKWSM